MDEGLKAPFPWYGGKRWFAPAVWKRLGKVNTYIEPFAGSLAILLANPTPARREIVSDADGHVANFWRSVRWHPVETAEAADWPCSHRDLRARHAWLLAWGRENAERLVEDPEWCDPKAAGWWAWGLSNWLGAGWCCDPATWYGSGPEGKAGNSRPFVADSLSGQGIQQNVPSLGWGAREWPRERLVEWFEGLAARLRTVSVLAVPWSGMVSGVLMLDSPTRRGKFGRVGIVLDPPYLVEDRSGTLYSSDGAGKSGETAREVYEWAVEQGKDPLKRIVMFAHEGDFEVPAGWRVETRTFGAGMSEGRHATRRDAMYVSPHCLDSDEEKQLKIEL